MESEELRYFLALNQLHTLIGPRRAGQLLDYFHHPQGVFEAGEPAWREAGLSEQAIAGLKSPDWKAVDHALDWSLGPRRRFILRGDAGYPVLLDTISDPPLVLYAEGDVEVLQRQQLAIVGSRCPTPLGRETATMLAASLAKTGFVITSGMALGIDAAGHFGALSADGRTIAVMGTGLDRVYPARHRALAEQIRDQGCLISEFPLGSQALARHFPMRNRIISGLARGVIVVEAAIKSGSLITARQALDQNREVFAVPGSIHSPTSRGCHWLLREGAKLVENIEDILEELGNNPAKQAAFDLIPERNVHMNEQPEAYRQVLSAVDFVPTSIDRIVGRTGLTADLVCSMLLILELDQLVEIAGNGQYSRCAGSVSSVPCEQDVG